MYVYPLLSLLETVHKGIDENGITIVIARHEVTK